MTQLVTFIIPIRHHENIRDKCAFLQYLNTTTRSISQQSSKNWHCVLVANHGTELPELPENFDVVRVDFPPNLLHDKGTFATADVMEAVRHDKGQRVLAAILNAPETRFIMPVDDDDLICKHIVEFIELNSQKEGWYVEQGYEFFESNNRITSLAINSFWRACGTCNIFRPARLDLPTKADFTQNAIVSKFLGAHVFLKPNLMANGVPLEPLPFRAAAYRRGHINSHSSKASVEFGALRRHVLNRNLFKTPVQNFRKLGSLRQDSKAFLKDFIGSDGALITSDE